MYKSRRREEPKTTFVRDLIVIVFILCLLTLVVLQFHNVMSWCGPPSKPHEYIMDMWEDMAPGECTGPIFSSLSAGQLDMDGCPPEHYPSYIHTKIEKFKPFDTHTSQEITSETVWTRCKLGLDELEENIHVQNIYDSKILQKAVARGPNSATGGPNELLSVTMLLISSLSGDHFARTMKETSNYLANLGAAKNDLFEAFPFTDYNIVAGDTLTNQLPIFSAAVKEGKDKDKEKPKEKEKGREKWIWEYFHKSGYVTMLSSEDCAYEGSIKTIVPDDMIDVEFDDVYCDESMTNPRVTGKVWQHGASCIGNRYVHRVLFSYIEDFLSNYIAAPRFTTGIFQTSNEPSQTRVKSMDKDLADFLQLLTQPDTNPTRFNIHPNSTTLSIIFLMSEQGEGDSPFFHHTKAGYVEHRKPLLYILAPKAWLNKYPHVRYNLAQNKDKLIVGHDIYQTLQDIPLLPLHTHTPSESHARPRTDQSFYSLFDTIPPDRECEMASIPNQYCTCETTYSFMVLIFVLPALLLFWWLYTWCSKINIKRTVYVNNLQLR
eukprot:Phypoly_transcript_00739.p2 GENE.Phypoly_transcript_00739~~Phypoly_transcript_00739.p2  ORF type:complete len:546 (+),score=82.51 Phypoly_transcript_00739:117-1754(+)